VLREAKKRDNDRYVTESADKPKAMWRLINREIGRATENEQKLELKVGNRIISNPTEITDKLNSHLLRTVKEMIKQNTMKGFMTRDKTLSQFNIYLPCNRGGSN
jgi:hypothetical protein